MKRSMHGSTLVETLVMMLVAGIVFLGVMEALSLFSGITARRSAALYEIGVQRDGFYRLEQLLSTADSLTARITTLSLLCSVGRREDALLFGVRIPYCCGNQSRFEIHCYVESDK